MSYFRVFAALSCIALLMVTAVACSDNGGGSLTGNDDAPSSNGNQARVDICELEIAMGGDPYRCEKTGFSDGAHGAGVIDAYCGHELACYGDDSEEEFDFCVHDLETFRAELIDDYGTACGQSFEGLIHCAANLSCPDLFDFEGCESEELHFEQTCSDSGDGTVDPLQQAAIESCDKHYQCGLMTSSQRDDCIADVESTPQESIAPTCEDALLDYYSCEHALLCDQFEDLEQRMDICEFEFEQIEEQCG